MMTRADSAAAAGSNADGLSAQFFSKPHEPRVASATSTDEEARVRAELRDTLRRSTHVDAGPMSGVPSGEQPARWASAGPASPGRRLGTPSGLLEDLLEVCNEEPAYRMSASERGCHHSESRGTPKHVFGSGVLSLSLSGLALDELATRKDTAPHAGDSASDSSTSPGTASSLGRLTDTAVDPCTVTSPLQGSMFCSPMSESFPARLAAARCAPLTDVRRPPSAESLTGTACVFSHIGCVEAGEQSPSATAPGTLSQSYAPSLGRLAGAVADTREDLHALRLQVAAAECEREVLREQLVCALEETARAEEIVAQNQKDFEMELRLKDQAIDCLQRRLLLERADLAQLRDDWKREREWNSRLEHALEERFQCELSPLPTHGICPSPPPIPLDQRWSPAAAHGARGASSRELEDVDLNAMAAEARKAASRPAGAAEALCESWPKSAAGPRSSRSADPRPRRVAKSFTLPDGRTVEAVSLATEPNKNARRSG